MTVTCKDLSSPQLRPSYIDGGSAVFHFFFMCSSTVLELLLRLKEVCVCPGDLSGLLRP